MSPPDWQWAAREKHAEHYMVGADTREECIAAARKEFGPCTVLVAEVRRFETSQLLPDADGILEQAGENAACNGCEDEDWPSVGDEAKAKLDALLQAWAAEHLPAPNWYEQIGEEEELQLA